MLEFQRATIDDFEDIKKITSKYEEFSCELSEINLLLWQELYDFTFCIKDGVLYTKNCVNGETTFGLPFSKNIKEAIDVLEEYCEENNLPLNFFAAYGERFSLFKKSFGDMFFFKPIRDSFEYIYSQSELANLSGKKFHSKRNHISGFNKKFEWCYEKLSEENVDDVKKMLAAWYNENRDKYNNNMKAEETGLSYILDSNMYKRFCGGVIKVDGQVAAFTLGCKINDNVFDINIEKALQKFEGAYAMINNTFAKNELTDFVYINREEDMGIEGLRKAKLSYKPVILLEKFLITGS